VWKPDKKLSDDRLGKPSAAIQARVEAARERQRQRFEDGSGMLAVVKPFAHQAPQVWPECYPF